MSRSTSPKRRRPNKEEKAKRRRVDREQKTNQRKACDTKQQFHQQAEAEEEAHRIRTRCCAYECKYCGHWHVGTSRIVRYLSSELLNQD